MEQHDPSPPVEQLPAEETVEIPGGVAALNMFSYIGTARRIEPGGGHLPARLFGTPEAALAWYNSPPDPHESKATREIYRARLIDFRKMHLVRPEPYLEVVP